MYLHHPVAGSTDVLAKNLNFHFGRMCDLEVELQERYLIRILFHFWGDVVFWQCSTDCLPPKPVALPLLV